MPTNIDTQYEKDPRRALLIKALSGEGQQAPLTPIAGALQGAKSILSGLLLNKLEGQYQERKAKFYDDSQAVINALGPDATGTDIARAFAASQNPDLQEEGREQVFKALKEGAEVKYGLTPVVDTQGRTYQLSSSGGAREIPGFEIAPTVSYVDYGGGVQPMTRYGKPLGGPIEKTTTPEGEAGRTSQWGLQENRQQFDEFQRQEQQAFEAEQAELKRRQTLEEEQRKAAEPPKEYQKIDLEQRKLETALDAYEAELKKSGATAKPGPEKARLQSLYQTVQDSIRINAGLGAPQGADLQLLGNRLKDPTGYAENVAETVGAYDLTKTALEQIRLVREQSRANAASAKDIYLKNQPAPAARTSGPTPGPMLGPQVQAGPPVINSAEERDRLPSGTEYIAPDGSRKRKP